MPPPLHLPKDQSSWARDAPISIGSDPVTLLASRRKGNSVNHLKSSSGPGNRSHLGDFIQDSGPCPLTTKQSHRTCSLSLHEIRLELTNVLESSAPRRNALLTKIERRRGGSSSRRKPSSVSYHTRHVLSPEPQTVHLDSNCWMALEGHNALSLSSSKSSLSLSGTLCPNQTRLRKPPDLDLQCSLSQTPVSGQAIDTGTSLPALGQTQMPRPRTCRVYPKVGSTALKVPLNPKAPKDQSNSDPGISLNIRMAARLAQTDDLQLPGGERVLKPGCLRKESVHHGRSHSFKKTDITPPKENKLSKGKSVRFLN